MPPIIAAQIMHERSNVKIKGCVVNQAEGGCSDVYCALDASCLGQASDQQKTKQRIYGDQ